MRVNADFSRLTPDDYEWIVSLQAGVKRVMLDRIGTEKARASRVMNTPAARKSLYCQASFRTRVAIILRARTCVIHQARAMYPSVGKARSFSSSFGKCRPGKRATCVSIHMTLPGGLT